MKTEPMEKSELLNSNLLTDVVERLTFGDEILITTNDNRILGGQLIDKGTWGLTYCTPSCRTTDEMRYTLYREIRNIEVNPVNG